MSRRTCNSKRGSWHCKVMLRTVRQQCSVYNVMCNDGTPSLMEDGGVLKAASFPMCVSLQLSLSDNLDCVRSCVCVSPSAEGVEMMNVAYPRNILEVLALVLRTGQCHIDKEKTSAAFMIYHNRWFYITYLHPILCHCKLAHCFQCTFFQACGEVTWPPVLQPCGCPTCSRARVRFCACVRLLFCVPLVQ